jgi:homoserine kinase
MTAVARGAGAYGACLSGAGPSVLALVAPDRAEEVAAAYRGVARSLGVTGEVRRLAIAHKGAEIIDDRGEIIRPVEQAAATVR